MTLIELLFWILVAIIAFFVIKAGLAILIVVIIALVLYYLFFGSQKSSTKYVYGREGYQQQNNPQSRMLGHYAPINYASSSAVQAGKIGHPDDWYIPVHQYYDEKMNNQYVSSPTMSCTVPQSTSAYCVQKQLQQNNDLNTAILNCVVPGRTSVACVH